MSFNATAYNPNRTLVHELDARTKIILVVLYSVTLFLIREWTGIALCIGLFAVCALAARLKVLQCVRQLIPLLVILVFTLIANSFSINVSASVTPHGLGAVSSGLFSGVDPVAIVGSFGFVPEGFARGCFYVIRIVLLVFASLILVTTTSSTELSRAIEQFIRPLSRFGLPTHDIATTVSIALRFIPVTIDEFQTVRCAQMARGANFETGSLMSRVKAWNTVLIPLFVGLFRRAERLATAMDVRCYGMARATHLNEARLSVASAIILLVGCALCIELAVFF